MPTPEDPLAGWSPAPFTAAGVTHEVFTRGTGPGDTRALPYFEIDGPMADALQRVTDLGGTVIHPGDKWAICKDSEGSPFALAASTSPT